MKKLLLIFLVISMQTMAQSPAPDYSSSAIESLKSWIDLDYVGDGVSGHQLDIYLPKSGHAPYPVVISIYGSAWFSNNLKGTTFTTGLGQRLLKEGFAVVSINYRSSHDAKFPAQIQDCKAAIRFVRANSKIFLLDSDFIAVTGWSSGGHLASMCGTTNGIQSTVVSGLTVDIEGKLGKNLAKSSKVDAVIDWFGPTDFLIMDKCGSSFRHDDPNSPESSLVGGPIQDNKDKVATANPISYVNKSNPPFLIFHGDKDPLVPHCQSEKLNESLKKESVPVELVLIPGGLHGPGVMIDKYYDQMIAFLQTKMKAQPKK
jgi:acetyl esterase/lipase